MNHLANVFWTRWRSEYVVMLQKRQKWHFKTREFRISDVMLVLAENFSIIQWALSRIIDTFWDFKGLINKVKVRTKASAIIRPFTKLCLITSENDAFGR